MPSGTSRTLSKRIRDTALKNASGLPEYVERLLKTIDVLNEQIALADQELAQLAEDDPVCKRLMSVPSVGPVTSMRFAAAIDDISRFPTAHAVQSFLGLTPGENSSSEKKSGATHTSILD
jgi:transposase